MPYKPHAKQVEAHRNDAKRKILLWSRQTGKTMFSVNEAWIKAIQHQGRYLIVFPTYRQAKDTIWNQYLPLIPKQLIKDINATDLKVTLHYLKGTVKLPGIGTINIEHDENMPPSTIELKGSENADLLRGMRAHGIIFDEYALQEPENWPAVFQPMLSTTNGWAMFISTPKGFNHFYDMVVDAERGRQGWWLSKATWRDNPAIDPNFIKQVRQEADEKGELSAFEQEYELKFNSVEGAVYPEFNRDIHVVNPEDVPREGTVYGAIDFGWAEEHPTAFNLIKIDADGNWWIFDELKRSKMQMADIAQQIRMKSSGMNLTLMIGDSARPEYIELLNQQGIPTMAAVKRQKSIPAGIAVLGGLMKPRIQLLGLPKPKLFVSSVCKNTIYEFESYKYPSKKVDRPASEEPVKKDDHFMDALRYLALHLKYGVADQRKPIPNNLHFDEFGMLN